MGQIAQISLDPEAKRRIEREREIDRNLSCEDMDSDELDGELNLSDDESGTMAREKMRTRVDAAAKAKRETYQVEFDTNIYKVSMDCLQHKGQIVAGDAEFCRHCKGVFNNT